MKLPPLPLLRITHIFLPISSAYPNLPLHLSLRLPHQPPPISSKVDIGDEIGADNNTGIIPGQYIPLVLMIADLKQEKGQKAHHNGMHGEDQ